MPARLFARPQPPLPWRTIVAAGLAGTATIAVLAFLSDPLGLPVLIAGFGSSCVLVFTFPDAPLSQPVNVIGGHLSAAACGLLVGGLLPVAWWSLALAVGLAIIVMAALRITHPPAGGNPIAAMLTGAGWSYLIVPILLGAVIIVLFSLAHRQLGARLSSGRGATRR